MKKLFKKLMAMLLTITLVTGMFPAVMASGEGTDETVTCEASEYSPVNPAEEYSEQTDAETNANTATEFEKELGTGAMDESGKETESDLEAENEEKQNSDFVTDSEGEITEDASSENEEKTVTDLSTEGEEELGSASTMESQENAESEPVNEENGETAPDSASEPEEKTGVDTSMEAEEDAEFAEDPNAGISLMSVNGDSDDYRNVLRIYYIGDVRLEKDFKIKWVPIYGPHHYEITVTRNNLDGTTTNIVSAFNTGTEPSYTVSGSYVSQNAESFSIYVEAYAGESGEELMLDAMTTVGVEKDSNHVEYLVKLEERKVYLLLEKTGSWQVPVEGKWPSKPTVTDVTTGENVYVYNWTEFDTGYIFNFCFQIEPGHMYRICAVDRSGRTAIYESVFMKDECKHEQEGVYWQPNQLKIRSVGQSAHKISGEGYTYCLSCLEMLKSYSIEREESHILDANGNCTVCGYRTGCAHTHTEYVLSTEDPLRYVQTTERTYHRTFRWEYETCVDCKQRLSKREDFSDEPHTMNQNGVCTLCGFGSSGDVCFHPKYQIAWAPNHPTTYTWVSDTLHLVEGYRYYVCADCAEPIGESFAATEYHGHTMDASGKCTLCENDSGCAHVNTETAWNKSYPITYTEWDLNFHTASGYKYRYCTSCFERIGESFAVTVQESHTVGKTWDPVYYTPTYTPLNETEHLMEGVEFNYCTECFGRISRSFFDNRTESHTLDASGNCTLCGYPNGCTHPNTETAWDSSYRITYTSASDTEHIAKGYMYRYCTSCFAKIGGRVPVRVSEKHTLDAHGDCTICDFRAGCAHKETKKQLVDISYSSVNKDTHEVVKLYSKVCANPACNKVLVRVEPSYTEKTQEAHSFQADACTLCGYTLADELTVYVTVSSETGNVGESISATAAVSGGDGGYSYGWKVLLDGAVKFETDMGFGSRYDYVANQEGSYMFVVFVRDSSGSTATAQSSPITVKHIHDYKAVSSTELINQDTTFHNVVTTTYEECSICHQETNHFVNTVREKHTAAKENHEFEHPHKLYFVCECGAQYDAEGKYLTANGEVQEADACCICHGHQYGEAVETSTGQWQKTCSSCGMIQNTEAPAEHVHSFSDNVTYSERHPHYFVYCECGVSKKWQNADATKILTCCECVGHIWEDPIRLPDGTFKQFCITCGQSQTVSPSKKLETLYNAIDIITEGHETAKKYQEEHNINDIPASTIWKTIAVQATNKLTEKGFVYTNEVLNTYSDQLGSVVCYFTKKSWDEQQIDFWESLLIEMLDGEDIEEQNIVGSAADVIKEFTECISGNVEFADVMTDENVIDAINKFVGLLSKLLGEVGKEDELREIKRLQINMKELYDSTPISKFGIAMNFISAAAEGASKSSEIWKKYSVLAQVSKKADEYMKTLESIIEIAEATKNTNLFIAADRLKKDIAIREKKDLVMQIQLLTELGCEIISSMYTPIGVKVTQELGKEVINDAIIAVEKLAEEKGIEWLGSSEGNGLAALGYIEVGAKLTKLAVNWDEAYKEAQQLMTINVMSSSLDIVKCLKEDDSEPMLKLWGLLQTKGCEQAQSFLNSWENANFLSVNEFGIRTKTWFWEDELGKVNKELDNERQFFIDKTGLPAN